MAVSWSEKGLVYIGLFVEPAELRWIDLAERIFQLVELQWEMNLTLRRWTKHPRLFFRMQELFTDSDLVMQFELLRALEGLGGRRRFANFATTSVELLRELGWQPPPPPYPPPGLPEPEDPPPGWVNGKPPPPLSRPPPLTFTQRLGHGVRTICCDRD